MRADRLKLATFVVCLALGVMQGSAFGWEVNLSGAAGFNYQYYSQRGKSGFFGPYNVDLGAATGGTFAPANAWLGPQVANIVSGADASRSNFTTLLFPQIRVDRALSIQGVYRIGNTDTDTFPGTTVSFAEGEWLQWFVTANVPWGLLAYGKRPFHHGCGLQFDASNRTQENLALASYYGPFVFGLGIYPWREIPGLFERTELQAWNVFDKNAINSIDLYAFMDYQAGCLNAGIATVWYAFHIGPEGASMQTLRDNTAPLDASVSEGSIYLKYANGRFFFNAEADWLYSTARWQKSLLGAFQGADALLFEPGDGSGSIFRPRYTQWWRGMVELGALWGPAKLSLLWSWIPGPDRRHGVLIDRQPVLVDLYRPNNVVFSPDHSNNTVFRQYSLIFNTDFGSGLGATANGSSNVLGRTSDGYIVDANVYAARLDYAVASNLNLWASFLYATRLSHGYGWGYIKPAGVAGGAITGAVDFTPTGTYAIPSPAIPDNSLGWEVDLCLNWTLLENWMFELDLGYWQPGKWFNYACVDKAVVGWDVPTAANNFGVNPDRSIDPILAVVGRLTVGF